METADIKNILLTQGYVSEADIAQAEQSGDDLVSFLFDQNLLTKDLFGQAMAEHYGVTFMDLGKQKIDEDTLHIIPEAVARAQQIMAVRSTDTQVEVGMVDPHNREIIQNIEKRTGKQIVVHYITPDDFEQATGLYKSSIKEQFDAMLATLQDETTSRDESDEVVVSMVNQLLEYAERSGASDVHIEPYRDHIVVRFRIDGIMHKVLELPKKFHELILARIKIMAKMKTDEHYAAQDGKLRYTGEQGVLDVRVSIVPIVEGENVVMRLLSSHSRAYSLENIGFSEAHRTIIERAIASPHGMILVTGPTGSGKTTSLYAMLKVLDSSEVHISTIEDPVEYDIEGISQIQVNTKTDLTFAKGLRAIVRQDPDIIMVGEIRDDETANIAVNSALTGHLVLSTLHTNDAPTTLPRLIDMGIEPYLVASTVNIVMAQRLVRKICMQCRVSGALTEDQKQNIEHHAEIKAFFAQSKHTDLDKLRVYHGTGCAVCNQTGFVGRIGIFEILEMDEEVKQLVTERRPSGEIMKKAREGGMKTMLEDGLVKVLNGETTFEEIMRVAQE